MPKMNWRERNARELARIAEIESKIPELARILGVNVLQKDSDKRWELQFGRYLLVLHYDNWKDRITVYANFLNLHSFRWHGNDSECLITISPNKTAEKIANDIQKRLIPDCDALYTVLVQRSNIKNRIEGERDAVAQAIAAHGNGRVIPENQYAPKRHEAIAAFGSKNFGETSGQAKVTNSETFGLSISMELRNVPPELANYIASLFGEYGE